MFTEKASCGSMTPYLSNPIQLCKGNLANWFKEFDACEMDITWQILHESLVFTVRFKSWLGQGPSSVSPSCKKKAAIGPRCGKWCQIVPWTIWVSPAQELQKPPTRVPRKSQPLQTTGISSYILIHHAYIISPFKNLGPNLQTFETDFHCPTVYHWKWRGTVHPTILLRP